MVPGRLTTDDADARGRRGEGRVKSTTTTGTDHNAQTPLTSICCGFITQHIVQQAVQQIRIKIESLQQVHNIVTRPACCATCRPAASPQQIETVELRLKSQDDDRYWP